MLRGSVACFVFATACHAAPPPVAKGTPQPEPDRPPWQAMRIAYRDQYASTFIDDAGRPRELDALPTGKLRWSHGALFVKDDTKIARCTVADELACRTVIDGPLGWSWAISPDGARMLASSSDERAAWIVDVASGERRDTPVREGTWLDAHRLVYMKGDQLWVWDDRGGDARKLGDAAPFVDARELSPSPDGKVIAVIGRRVEHRDEGILVARYGYVQFDVERRAWGTWHGSHARDRGMLGTALNDASWSPSGARATYRDETQLVIVERGTPRRLRHAAEQLLGWLDEHRIAYLRLASVDDSEVRRYGHGLVRTTCNVAVLDVDTGRETALTDDARVAQCGAMFERR
jgi:hypothetical protein